MGSLLGAAPGSSSRCGRPGVRRHSTRRLTPVHQSVVGVVASVDATAQTCTVRTTDGAEQQLAWDRLVLNPSRPDRHDLEPRAP
jgi:hypothetical protein